MKQDVRAKEITFWEVQVQHTAGAYRTHSRHGTHKEAVGELKDLAANRYEGEFPYDGSDTFKAGHSVHNVDRYRIVPVSLGGVM